MRIQPTIRLANNEAQSIIKLLCVRKNFHENERICFLSIFFPRQITRARWLQIKKKDSEKTRVKNFGGKFPALKSQSSDLIK